MALSSTRFTRKKVFLLMGKFVYGAVWLSFLGQNSVFFFYVKIGLPCVKIFAVTLREKVKSAWKNIKKCPWKSPSLRENFVKKQCVKIKILYVKKYKNCMRENKKVPVKKSWKIIKCTFFWRHFSILCLFFLVSSGFCIFDPKFCAWN